MQKMIVFATQLVANVTIFIRRMVIQLNNKNTIVAILLIITMVGTLVWQASARQEESGAVQLAWSVVGSGGATTRGGDYVVGGTSGQAGGSAMSGGGYAVEGGFWAGVVSPGEPLLERVMLPVVKQP